MKVETYRELKSKDELFPLIDQALWEYLNPIEFEQDIEADPRLKHSPIGYAAIEKGLIRIKRWKKPFCIFLRPI